MSLICAMSNKPLFIFSICCIFVLTSGCSFKMGGPVSGVANLHIRVKNDSLAPLLGARLDRELRKNILRNGSLNLVNKPEDADSFLVVTLTNYSDTTEAYRPGDTLLAAGLNLRTSAKIEFTDHKGNDLYRGQVGADSSVLRPQSTQLPDDAMALQALAESLASKICFSLLNQAW